VNEVVEAICHWELIMPSSEHGVLVHAWIEICLRVLSDGPVHSFSGLSMERYMGLIRTQMHDRARPETSFVNHHSLGVALVNVGGAFQAQITQGYTAKELKTVLQYLPSDMLKQNDLCATVTYASSRPRFAPLPPLMSAQFQPFLADRPASTPANTCIYSFDSRVKIGGQNYRTEVNQRKNSRSCQYMCWYGRTHIAILQRFYVFQHKMEQVLVKFKRHPVDRSGAVAKIADGDFTTIIRPVVNLGDIVAHLVLPDGGDTLLFTGNKVCYPNYGGD
jgi:hypothetical protein